MRPKAFYYFTRPSQWKKYLHKAQKREGYKLSHSFIYGRNESLFFSGVAVFSLIHIQLEPLPPVVWSHCRQLLISCERELRLNA